MAIADLDATMTPMQGERPRWWRWRHVALALAGGAGLVAVGAAVSVPMVPIPMTLQSLAVVVVGALLGPIWGMAALLLYLALGAAGLPIFADGGSGVDRLFSAGAGYLWSFPLAAALAGLADRVTRDSDHRVLRLFLAFVAAHLLILALGVWGLARTLVLTEALSVGAWPFLPGMLVKSAIGAWLGSRIGWRFSGPARAA